jgi:hypothetical protein
MKKFLFRVWLLIVFVMLPLFGFIMSILFALPTCLTDVKAEYREWPKAWRAGGRV